MLHHFKLQLPHCAQEHIAAHLGLENLDRTFFAQLRQALLQLLGTQRVFEYHGHKHLGRKKRQAGVLQVDRAIGNRVAQLHPAVGGKAHNVAGISLFHCFAALAHKSYHAGGAQLFGGAHYLELHAWRVLARSHAHKGDAIAVVGIHVGLHLEDHAAKGLVFGLHFLHHRLAVDLHGAGTALR